MVRRKLVQSSRELSVQQFHLKLATLADSLSKAVITLSRRLMFKLLDANFQQLPLVEISQVCISDEDKEVIAYLSGFVLFKMKQETYRLADQNTVKAEKCSIVRL